MSQLDHLEPLDLNETKDYRINWARQLSPLDTISSSSLLINSGPWPVVPVGLAKESDTHDDITTTIWVSAEDNAAGSYKLTNRIVTTGGRTLDQSITIRIRER
jgi:hypothetical protein